MVFVRDRPVNANGISGRANVLRPPSPNEHLVIAKPANTPDICDESTGTATRFGVHFWQIRIWAAFVARAQPESCRTASVDMNKWTRVFIGLSIAAGALLAGCSESTDPAAAPTVDSAAAADAGAVATPTVATTAATPTTAPEAAATAVPAPEPTVAATAPEATPEPAPDADEEPEFVSEAVVPPPVIDVAGCAPGASTDEQKVTLVKMAEARFAGLTVFEADQPRLHYPPEARNNRQGGIWLVVEFNGDDRGEVADKKASLDLWMTEAYDLFYNSGCDELTKVDLSGYGEALGRPPIGPTVISHAIVFKTSMKKADADAVDWANKETLDFEEIWDVQLINVRWGRELAGMPLD